MNLLGFLTILFLLNFLETETFCLDVLDYWAETFCPEFSLYVLDKKTETFCLNVLDKYVLFGQRLSVQKFGFYKSETFCLERQRLSV